MSTGAMKMMTIHDADPTVRAKRAWKKPRRRRARHEEPEIVGQEERRQRCDHAAEREEREEGQEQPRQAKPQQVIAELFVGCELRGHPVGAVEQHARRRPDRAKTIPRSRSLLTRRTRLRDAHACGSSRKGNGCVDIRSLVDFLERCRGELQKHRGEVFVGAAICLTSSTVPWAMMRPSE